jgi:L-fucose isomerase
MIIKPKLAVVTIGDTRLDFYVKRENIVRTEIKRFEQAFNKEFDLLISEPVLSLQDALIYADQIKQNQIACVVIHLPIWATPTLALRIANSTSLPVMLLGNKRNDSSSLVGLLAVAGMLEQSGQKIIRWLGDIDEPETRGKIRNFAKACHTIDQLSRSSYCLLGGRSIGIGTGVADPAQWQKLFGIEFDHCDQSEIIRRAEEISEQRVETYRRWLTKYIGKINFEGLFTPDSLNCQIKSYLAVKDLVTENSYDFLGLKCQQEMSDYYAVQCLAVALLNNNYDAEGAKKVIPCSCEADTDGALTMKILSLCNNLNPVNLVDIRNFNPETKDFIFANCGAMAFHFASPDNMEAAMHNVHLLAHTFGKAGGGTTQFVAAEGDVTVARLFRKNGKYIMSSFEGSVVVKDREELRKTNYCYPHVFITADIDYELFFQTIGANHMHMSYGKYTEVLQMICDMKQIEYINYNSN